MLNDVIVGWHKEHQPRMRIYQLPTKPQPETVLFNSLHSVAQQT